MTRYKMEDGTVVDTDNASESWQEKTRWDGRNHISVATGSQWHHETLYRSRKGRYYIEHTSNYQGDSPHVDWIGKRAAAAWILANDGDLPDDLASEAEEVSE